MSDEASGSKRDINFSFSAFVNKIMFFWHRCVSLKRVYGGKLVWIIEVQRDEALSSVRLI